MRSTRSPGNPPRRLRAGLTLAAVPLLGIGLTVVLTAPASAATGCRVDYTVNQWSGGFSANVALTNLGDPLNGWRLEWTFPSGQTVTQGWGGQFSQSGARVTVTNASWNATLGTNATVTPGFNGSWSGTNSPPTSFSLNGVPCTGAPGTTQQPTATPAPTPSQPGAVAWRSSEQWGTWTNGGYTLYNNIWGSGAGSQTIWANSYGNWGVTANHPNTGGVKSYPNATRNVNRNLSAIGSLTSGFNVTVPNSGAYASTYDIWADNHKYEIMLWMNKTGPVGPLGSLQTTASLGGHTWQVYRGSNGANEVFSFIRTSNTNSGTVDIRAVLNWIRNAGWYGDVLVGDVQFGYEITSSAGGLNFTTNSFSVSYS
ncbi:cellulose binding domain-containing protein [Micromonospora sp. WMMD1102]|uniref:cellulose binding domain-containing protein n=1 Tax=Micromonospora sp. WMMD1102 TaxID=3016105 RepID=UPI0024151835|nr:cellulose binding domain-containing protein [Micromonospora sp. WMMD1102]MDG4786045.1 cellulose binding domain-containing protein [Micromonospora sp. WMMD1102]